MSALPFRAKFTPAPLEKAKRRFYSPLQKAKFRANLARQSPLIRIVKRQREISRIAVEVVHAGGSVLGVHEIFFVSYVFDRESEAEIFVEKVVHVRVPKRIGFLCRRYVGYVLIKARSRALPSHSGTKAQLLAA